MDEEWEEYDPSSGLTFTDHMVAGSAAGVMEHVAMFPVDTLKTHLQAATSPAAAAAASATPGGNSGTGVAASAPGSAQQVSARRLYQNLTHDRGIWRLWRGVHSLAIGCVPSHAAYFSIYEISKEALGANRPGHHPFAAGLAGMLSVCVHDAVMTPVDLIKQRLQLGYYRGMWDCVRTVARAEGVRAFFLAYPTTLAMNVPHHAVMVAANESFKRLLARDGETDAALSALVFSGAAAGALAAVITTPLDVIKTRLQTQGVTALDPPAPVAVHHASAASSVRHLHNSTSPTYGRVLATPLSYRMMPAAAFAPLTTTHTAHTVAGSARLNGFLDAARQIYLKEGWIGFTRGLVPRLLVHAPSSAICWTTYELLKQALLRMRHRAADA